jgi:phosphatidylglycerol:prolipoprotein diacylglycerol transferase
MGTVFPVYLHLGPLAIHPHRVFEALAYFAGLRLYAWLRARRGDPVPDSRRFAVIAAGTLGAAAGSKLMYLLSDPFATLTHRADLVFLLEGKSIVGALVAGLIAIEIVKRAIGERRSTGDLFALPLAVGTATGRVGCFLTGLDDHTHGLPAALPWAVDYGDGIPRHPAQLYEIALLLLLGAALWHLLARPPLASREGDVFRTFMVGYLAFRLWVEFVKPGVPFAGLNAIQWVCFATLAYYTRDLPRLVSWWLAPFRPATRDALAAPTAP